MNKISRTLSIGLAVGLSMGLVIVLIKVGTHYFIKYKNKSNYDTVVIKKYTTTKQVPYLIESKTEQVIVDGKNYVHKNKSYICRARYRKVTTYDLLQDKKGKYIRDEKGNLISDDKVEYKLIRNKEARYQVVNPDGDILYEQTIKCPNPTKGW